MQGQDREATNMLVVAVLAAALPAVGTLVVAALAGGPAAQPHRERPIRHHATTAQVLGADLPVSPVSATR